MPYKIGLPTKYVNTVCLAAPACRFILEEDGKHFCLKLVPVLADIINAEVADYLAGDPAPGMPVGDNCEGVHHADRA